MYCRASSMPSEDIPALSKENRNENKSAENKTPLRKISSLLCENLESRTKSQGFKVLENHDLLAKHVVFDDSEKFEISYFGTTFQNDL